MNVLHHYPEAASLVQQDDIEVINRLLCDTSRAELAEWVKTRTTVRHMGDSAFKLLIDIPSESDSSRLLIVGGEYGNGLSEAVAIRARVVRDLVAPEATLIVQPNSSFGFRNSHGLARAERQQLSRGDVAPLVDRLRSVVDASNSSEVTFVGPSQAGVIASAFAAHGETPPTNVAIVETPNTHQRSSWALVKDFAGYGANLKDNIALNFPAATDTEPVRLKEELIGELTVAGFARYGIGLVQPDNLALRGIMRRPTLRPYLEAALDKGSGVTHAWGVKDRVSSDEANRVVSGVLSSNASYEAYRFEGGLADHSLTNVYPVLGALARRAAQLGTRS